MSTYIKALVIQKNNTVFLSGVDAAHSGGTGTQSVIPDGIGATFSIPCPGVADGGVIDGDFWAKPVNEGTVSGFTFTPRNLQDGNTPDDAQWFAVVKISSNQSADVWYVVGSSDDYIASCEVCCGDSPVLMDTIADIPVQAGCQTLCNQDANGAYFGVFGVPSIAGVQRLYPKAYFNGAAVTPAAIASGYTSASALLAFLNASWSALGVWTKTADNKTIILTQGGSAEGTDEICMDIFAITPSV